VSGRPIGLRLEDIIGGPFLTPRYHITVIFNGAPMMPKGVDFSDGFVLDCPSCFSMGRANCLHLRNPEYPSLVLGIFGDSCRDIFSVYCFYF